MTDWVRLRLDVSRFDDTPFLPLVNRLHSEEVRFVTFADIGDTDASRHALYDLNATCSADIPGRGPFYTFESYVAERVEVPSFSADGVVIALAEQQWIAMTATSLHVAEDFAFSEMTGVVRDHRRRGIALALKLSAIEFAKRAGVRWLKSSHHRDNTPPIALNRRLGFTDDPDATSRQA